jgi:hypothetical protein
MSSPIHLDEDIDPALIYAPPWARERVPAEIAGRPAALLSETDDVIAIPQRSIPNSAATARCWSYSVSSRSIPT